MLRDGTGNPDESKIVESCEGDNVKLIDGNCVPGGICFKLENPSSHELLRSYDVSEVPEAEESASSSSSEMASATSSVEVSWPSPQFNDDKDSYADVRARMEELSARDKAMYATHTSDEPVVHKDHSIVPAVAAFSTYLCVYILISCGRVRDILAGVVGGRYSRKKSDRPSDDLSKFAPLLKSWEDFFKRRIYHRIQDCFNRPVASNPGAHIAVVERVSSDGNKSMQFLGSLDSLDTDEQKQAYQDGDHFVTLKEDRVARSCLNLGSYNYLGFADDWGVTCKKDVIETLEKFPVSASACRTEFGTTSLHRKLEKAVADFLGKEDSVVLTMGFNTNATTIPALVGKDDLILSDELNHTSIINGARASGAKIRVFKHNSSEDLEEVLREAIINMNPETKRPWRRILVIVEGVYSMEGEYCDLRSIVDICKRYGAYVYLDEAHSVGAVGPSGRGIADYAGVDTADIDVMMGTFTKSFGGMGGYIAASKEICCLLRERCAGSSSHNSLSPVVCQQVLTCFKVITGCDGTKIGKRKIEALRDNSNYMRMKLNDLGLLTLGHYDSPIIPVMLYSIAKMAAFSRECYRRGLATVVVGFPAVPLLLARVRFCISAGHTRQDLDRALKEIQEIADVIGVKYGKGIN